jgi:membrane-associated protease RseP (regulator of RpoE activity)
MLEGVQERATAAHDAVNARLPPGLRIGALTLYWYSTRSSEGLDRLAARRAWRRWTDMSVLVLLVVQVTGLVVVGLAAVQALGQESATALNDPANTVAIPGVNAFMPLASAPYVVAALLVATVVHEGGHAVACRAARVPVREWGIALLFGVVPLAGYVMPGEELDAASVRDRLRVYAIGVFHNLLVAGVALAVLFSPATGTPRAVFIEYFGWAVIGEAPPTAASVAGLSVLTHLAFWLALLNANFGLLNALPVSVLDGGRVLSLAIEGVDDRTRTDISPRARWVLVHVASVAVVALVVVALFAPLF